MKKIFLIPLLLFSISAFAQATFSPYIETNPVDAMIQVGMYKQRQYENNSRNIHSLINDISGLLGSTNYYDPNFVEKATNDLNEYISRINKLDWTNYDNYESIMSVLSKYKNYVENSEQTIMDNYYRNKHQ